MQPIYRRDKAWNKKKASKRKAENPENYSVINLSHLYHFIP
jgi:hypothetical protein